MADLVLLAVSDPLFWVLESVNMDVDLVAWEEGSEDSEAGLEEGLAGLWGKEEHRGAHGFDDMDHF